MGGDSTRGDKTMAVGLRTMCWVARSLRWVPGRWRLIRRLKSRGEEIARLGPQVVRIWTGQRIRVDPADFVSREIFITGDYEGTTTELFRRLLRPGDSAIDVGANIGYFCLVASHLVGPTGRVHAFEASGRISQLTRGNLELNRIDNVLLRQVAVGDENGSITFHTASDDHLGISTMRPSGVAEGSSEQVESIRLDSAFQPSDRIGLVKIDVEGAEMLVLRGMTSLLEVQRPPLVLELTDSFLRELGSSAFEVINLLKERDYELYRTDWDGLRRLGVDEGEQVNVFAWPLKAHRDDRWRDMLRDERSDGSANEPPVGKGI